MEWERRREGYEESEMMAVDEEKERVVLKIAGKREMGE